MGNLMEARDRYQHESPQPALDMSNLNFDAGITDDAYSWEMIGLGLEEPLPQQDVIDELHVSRST
jgi:hypothetical protein